MALACSPAGALHAVGDDEQVAALVERCVFGCGRLACSTFMDLSLGDEELVFIRRRTSPWSVRPNVRTSSGRCGDGSAGWTISDIVEGLFMTTRCGKIRARSSGCAALQQASVVVVRLLLAALGNN